MTEYVTFQLYAPSGPRVIDGEYVEQDWREHIFRVPRTLADQYLAAYARLKELTTQVEECPRYHTQRVARLFLAPPQ